MKYLIERNGLGKFKVTREYEGTYRPGESMAKIFNSFEEAEEFCRKDAETVRKETFREYKTLTF